MTIFEHLITLMSFILSLAMVTLAVFLAKLIRHRTRVVWSAPHGLWMLNSLLSQVVMWVASYQLHGVQKSSGVSVLAVVVFPLLLFLQAEMVAPGDAQPADLDLKSFHQRYGRRYIGIGLAYVLLAVGYQGWIAWRNNTPYLLQDLLPQGILLVSGAAALAFRSNWVQVGSPLVQIAVNAIGVQMMAAGMSQ